MHKGNRGKPLNWQKNLVRWRRSNLFYEQKKTLAGLFLLIPVRSRKNYCVLSHDDLIIKIDFERR